MRIYKPAYFPQFRCIASDCPDPCCKDWDIEVDPKTAEFYRSVPGELGDRIRAALYEDPEYGTTIALKGDRCPLWRPDGLCGIQAELGEDALCDVCKTFPRLHHDYGNFMEYGLELSCPEAARIILSAPSFAWEISEVPGGSEPEYDEDAMEVLQQTRREAMKLVVNPAYSIPQALILLLYYGHQAQNILDGEEVAEFDAAGILAETKHISADAGPEMLFAFFQGLEILTPEWDTMLKSTCGIPEWSEPFRNLMQYGIQRYWLQAVSDYDLVVRVKFIVISCLTVHFLGGDLVKTAHLYSKEIENDADNVDAVLDGAYDSPALTDDRLITLLKM